MKANKWISMAMALAMTAGSGATAYAAELETPEEPSVPAAEQPAEQTDTAAVVEDMISWRRISRRMKRRQTRSLPKPKKPSRQKRKIRKPPPQSRSRIRQNIRHAWSRSRLKSSWRVSCGKTVLPTSRHALRCSTV